MKRKTKVAHNHSAMSAPLLSIENAVVVFRSQGASTHALDGVSLEVFEGETLAVVGESGCGKTTLARAVLGLQALESGSIQLGGKRITGVPQQMAKLAGMVWQDPYASLDPRWTIGQSVSEPAKLCNTAIELDEILSEVGLDATFASRYPHQLSGGQRQRVAIGRALAMRPRLVICDEPTAALDLSIQAQILNLLRDLQELHRCSYLYISHDLLTVRFIADRVAVMYLGRIVEMGPTQEVFSNPRHPYTQMLMDSAPTIQNIGEVPRGSAGEIPDQRSGFVGCRFASRCPIAQDRCHVEDPPPLLREQTSVWCLFA